MVSRALTPIQKKVLHFIEEETLNRGSPPTLRAICAEFGFKALGTVQSHLQALIKKGFLERDEGKARGLRVLHQRFSRAMSIPILGKIQAGHPQEAIEVGMGTLSVPLELARKGKLFALKVVGESMTGAGILEGDWVIARQQPDAQHRDIVVAIIENEATVKRLEKKRGKVRLLPENPNFSPILVDKPEVYIQGKVVALKRDYE